MKKVLKNIENKANIVCSIINEKKNSGITLIALVITIVVLLILAGVTIATLTGDNRNINTSKQSQRKNRTSKNR